jgi:hypothetical protein
MTQRGGSHDHSARQSVAPSNTSMPASIVADQVTFDSSTIQPQSSDLSQSTGTERRPRYESPRLQQARLAQANAHDRFLRHLHSLRRNSLLDADLRDVVVNASREIAEAVSCNSDVAEHIAEDLTIELDTYSILSWDPFLAASDDLIQRISASVYEQWLSDSQLEHLGNGSAEHTVVDIASCLGPIMVLLPGIRRHIKSHPPGHFVTPFNLQGCFKLQDAIDDAVQFCKGFYSGTSHPVPDHETPQTSDQPEITDPVVMEPHAVDYVPTAADPNSDHSNPISFCPLIQRHPKVHLMAHLAYPDIPPPSSNHLFGCYVPGSGNTPEEQRENQHWVLYGAPITTYQLPMNVGQSNQHWTDIIRHDGTYVDRSGQSHKPGTPGHPGPIPPTDSSSNWGPPTGPNPFGTCPALPRPKVSINGQPIL